MSTQPSPEQTLDSQTPTSLRTLGTTPIQITPIGLGMMEFAGVGG